MKIFRTQRATHIIALSSFHSKSLLQVLDEEVFVQNFTADSHVKIVRRKLVDWSVRFGECIETEGLNYSNSVPA